MTHADLFEPPLEPAFAAVASAPKPREPKRISPTQRSLAEMRGRGYDCSVVEHWNPHVVIEWPYELPLPELPK